jgi:DNA mismatch repair protein MutS2
LEERIQELEIKEAKVAAQLEQYEKLSRELALRKKEIIEKAKLEAASLLKDSNREIEKTIRHIRENQAQKKETLRVRKTLGELTKKVEPGASKHTQSDLEIVAGDRVRIVGQHSSGEVLSVKGKYAMVQFGEIKSKVALDRLEQASKEKSIDVTSRLRSVGLDVRHKQSNFKSTLDIRGKRVDEVVSILEQYMDDAILLGHGELRILHGKGEGVLRKIVREQLHKYKQVASVMDEHIERGGDGVTVVVLK